ncbi:hypothetical protein RRG08_009882 [Elysia crispata]|uniref:Uncharacterized protein n=1 Tax=Elysia crispata TaxID=231223 RepID=A0AAE1D9I3_9GAST|nr:hypothetical protein RRG08_009882 [Elysia crispata]
MTFSASSPTDLPYQSSVTDHLLISRKLILQQSVSSTYSGHQMDYHLRITVYHKVVLILIIISTNYHERTLNN